MNNSTHRNSIFYNSTNLFNEPHKITTGKIIEEKDKNVIHINDKIIFFEVSIGTNNNFIYTEKIKIISKNKIYFLDVINKSQKIFNFLNFFNFNFGKEYLVFFEENNIPIENYNLKRLIPNFSNKLKFEIRINNYLFEKTYFLNFSLLKPVYYYYFNTDNNLEIQYQDFLFTIYNISDKEFNLFFLTLKNKNIEFEDFLSIFSNKKYVSIYKNN